jgi:protein involved in polysaccharide export with SLBB domain
MVLVSRLVHCLALWLLVVVMACQPQLKVAPPQLPPPMESTTLGPGDIFRLEVVGEKDYPTEYQVAADGTVNFPYLDSALVAGLEPQEVAKLVRENLIKREILTQPSVIVRVTEYRSKRVTVLGQVKSPGSFPFQAGMTLVQALSQAGGATAIAMVDQVRLTRLLAHGKSTTIVVDVAAINAGALEDIFLQAGDRIFVEERVF